MKKLIYFFALLGMAGMAACSGRNNDAAVTEVVVVTDSIVPDTMTIAVYEGILPGADVSGIQYILALGQTETGDSVYQMTLNYLGMNDNNDTTYIQEGQWGIIKNGRILPRYSTVYQLSDSSGVIRYRFLDMNDSIVLLGQDMQLPSMLHHYSLKKK